MTQSGRSRPFDNVENRVRPGTVTFRFGPEGSRSIISAPKMSERNSCHRRGHLHPTPSRVSTTSPVSVGVFSPSTIDQAPLLSMMTRRACATLSLTRLYVRPWYDHRCQEQAPQ